MALSIRSLSFTPQSGWCLTSDVNPSVFYNLKLHREILKSYDAVAEVRKVRDRLAEEMQGMSPDEQIAFLRKRAAQARRERAERMGKSKN